MDAPTRKRLEAAGYQVYDHAGDAVGMTEEEKVLMDLVVKRVTVKGTRMVMLAETEFDRLLRIADEFEPLMPPPDADGNYPAVETVRMSIAIDIVRHRRRLALSQKELARRAGIRPESLNRIEQGHVDPNTRTLKKIDQALKQAERETDPPKPKGTNRAD